MAARRLPWGLDSDQAWSRSRRRSLEVDPELVKVAITPLPDDAIVDGEVMDPHLVSDVIRSTIDAVGGNTKSVVAAVGGRDVIIKRIKTERVKEAQARELMRWEAEQHVPDVDSVELDFQILDSDGDGRDEMSVLLVAAKRDLVEAKLRILAEAGITPSSMDVDAFALHNAFEINYPAAMSGAVGLADVGPEVANHHILDDGVRFSRATCHIAPGGFAKIFSASTGFRRLTPRPH